MKNYLVLYIINILISCFIFSFFDKNMSFLFPFVITVTVMYIPILLINKFLNNVNVLQKNIIYIFLGMLLYVGLLSFINGSFSLKYIFISDASGFITIYSFIILMLLHGVLFHFFKREY